MSYITTVTGIHFYPLNPNPKDIDIEDIHNRLSPDRGDSFAAAAGGIRIRLLYLANTSNRANQEIRKLSK